MCFNELVVNLELAYKLFQLLCSNSLQGRFVLVRHHALCDCVQDVVCKRGLGFKNKHPPYFPCYLSPKGTHCNFLTGFVKLVSCIKVCT